MCEEYSFVLNAVNVSVLRRSRVAAFFLSHRRFCAHFSSFSCEKEMGEERKKFALFVSSLRNGKRENVPRERNEDRQVVVLVSRVTMARVVFYHQAHIAV